jgi:hypothetical protein
MSAAIEQDSRGDLRNGDNIITPKLDQNKLGVSCACHTSLPNDIF